MAEKRRSVSDDILDVIDYAVQRAIRDLKENFVRSSIKEATSDGKYIVSLFGADYTLQSGCGIAFTSGDRVWVHIPDNNYNHAYICASASGKVTAGTTIVQNITNNDYSTTGGGGGEAYVDENDVATKQDIDDLFS